SCIHPVEEFSDAYLQSAGDPQDRLDAGVADAAFNPANKRAVEVSLLSELVLGKSSLGPNPGHIATEGEESSVTVFHRSHHAPDDARSSVAYRLQCSKRELWLVGRRKGFISHVF